mgnify:FL=1
MKRIVSSIPGRARLRDQQLCDSQQLDRVRNKLSVLAGVLSVDGNPRAGSLIVCYDSQRQDPARMDAKIELVAATELAKPRLPVKRSIGRVQVNRYAKRGMLTSLAVSMLLAAAGQKRWHAATGGVFLPCLMVHLAVHRRHLIR